MGRQNCYHIWRLLNHIPFLWWFYQYWCCVSDYQPRSASLLCQWHSHSLGYPAANNSSTKDTLTSYGSAFNMWFPFFFGGPVFLFLLIWVIGSSGSLAFTHALIHANFTSHTTSSPLSTHNSLSLHHLCIQWGTVFANFLISSSVFSF